MRVRGELRSSATCFGVCMSQHMEVMTGWESACVSAFCGSIRECPADEAPREDSGVDQGGIG